jgi:hypothetical protein
MVTALATSPAAAVCSGVNATPRYASIAAASV